VIYLGSSHDRGLVGISPETDKRKVALMQLVEDEKLYCALLTSLVEV
jgi:hypothetical protein